MGACAASTGILQTGPNTYTITDRVAPARGGATVAQQSALSQANAFCAQQGRTIQVTEMNSPVRILGHVQLRPARHRAGCATRPLLGKARSDISRFHQPAQSERFIEAAREAGCSEDEAAFDDALRRIAEAKPTTPAKRPENDKK